jgi:hypothetical protein
MDEKWPVFTILTPEQHKNQRPIERCLAQDEFVDLPDDVVMTFIKIQEEYLVMQKQLEEIYDREQNKDEPETSEDGIWNDLLEDSQRVHGIP